MDQQLAQSEIVTLYPSRLIPNKDFSFIVNFNDDDVLGHWVKDGTPLKLGNGKLDPTAVEIKRLHNYSINKIPHSDPADLKIGFVNCTKERETLFETYWEPGIDGVTPENTEWQSVEERNLFFFKVLLLHGFTDDYTKAEKKGKFKVSVKHKPILVNYWHFELEVSDMESGEVIENLEKKTWKKGIAGIITDKLVDIARFSHNDFE